MKVVVDEMWVTPGSLVFRVVIWASDGAWRQKRYASLPLAEVPEEVVLALSAHYLDDGADEDLEALPGL